MNSGTRGKGRITPWQLALLFVMTVSLQESTGVNRLLTPLAGRDIWVPLLLSVPPGLLGVWLILRLAALHPGRDLCAIARRLLGPFAWPLVLTYVLLFVVAAAETGAEFTALSHLVFVSAPPLAFLLPLVGMAVYASLLGVEVVARVNGALLLAINIPLGLLIAALSVGSQRLSHLLPVLADGWQPVLAGMQLTTGTFGQLVLLLVLLPLTDRPGRAGKASLWAVVLATVIALGHNIGPVLTFGGAAGAITWPTFELIKTIEAGRFIQRLDVMTIWLWVSGSWLLIALFLHAAALTLANLLRLSRPRPLVLPLGAATLLLALAVPNQALSMRLRWDINAIAFLVLGFGVPLVLLLWSLASERLSRAEDGGSPEGQAADEVSGGL